MWLLVLLVCFLVWAVGTYWFLFGKPSPFSMESVRPPGPLELDQKTRDQILKQGFRKDNVPENLDAIVIGSGIGGMTTAAILAKLGKRVLVLEQHDQAGGCCHTYIEKGFEFEAGLHYIGQLHENSLLKVIMDQLTEGQLQFVELDKHIDTVVIGSKEKSRAYTIYSGRTEMKEHLKEQFPNDTKAIEEFFRIMKISARHTPYLAAMKLIPEWVALFLLKSGIANLFSSIFRLVGTDATTFADSLTSNKDLQIIFYYLFYGVPPKESSCSINALLLHHYKRGAYFPKGGASEIPLHITKVIQKYGGRVLVRANVSRILVDDKGSAYGVTVKKAKRKWNCELLLSSPAVEFLTPSRNFFHYISKPNQIQERLNMVRPGRGCVLVFSGFDATQEELGIKSHNTWCFKNNDMDAMMDEYFGMGKDEAPENIPFMYFTFPSAKDPTFESRHPGKSCMIILTMANYEWFEEWKDAPARRRGDDYVAYKMRFANKLFNWACVHYPKLREKLVFQEVSTPLSNSYYLGSYRGATYSAEHNLERFQAEAIVRNRCDTPVKNLYISGQDVFSCGITGALHGGILCASAVLKQIVHFNLMMLKKKLKTKRARETAADHAKKVL